MYLCGVKGVEAGGVAGQEVREYLHETAWRCTQWDQGSESVHSGAGRSGYHQSIVNCLTSLKDGELTLLKNSLSEAR